MFRFNQKGFSLPLVLGILGLVIANTYYFMNLEQTTKTQNIKRGAEIDDNTEKVRVASFLSDVSVCASPENFGNKTISDINLSSPSTSLRKDGNAFLNVGSKYSQGALHLDGYKIVQSPDPAVPLEKQFTLIVTYSIFTRHDLPVDTLKKKIIRIPIFIGFSGAANPTNPIKSCYAEYNLDSETAGIAITNACLGNTALLIETGLPECQHSVVDIDCPEGQVLKGASVGPGMSQLYTCAGPTGLSAGTTSACPTTPIRTLVTQVTSIDSVNCGTTDNACPAGTVLVMSATGGPTCGSTCMTGDNLFQRINSGVPTCFPRPQPCGLGKYVKEIKADGTPTCVDYTIVSKTCSAGNYAADVNPTSSIDNVALGCRAYVKTKNCSSPSPYTFVSSFTSVNPACTTYSN